MILVNCKAFQKHSGVLQGFPIASLAAPLVVASVFFYEVIQTLRDWQTDQKRKTRIFFNSFEFLKQTCCCQHVCLVTEYLVQ